MSIWWGQLLYMRVLIERLAFLLLERLAFLLGNPQRMLDFGDYLKLILDFPLLYNSVFYLERRSSGESNLGVWPLKLRVRTTCSRWVSKITGVRDPHIPHVVLWSVDRVIHWESIKPEDRGYETLCLVWTGKLTSAGYARWKQELQLHRWAYETFVGPIPDGLVVDHLCEVRSCVRPDHLDPCTDRENLRRKYERRAARGRLKS